MPQPWWMTDEYSIDTVLPSEFEANAGPHGVAIVRAFPNEKTDGGWGEDSFMESYKKRFARLRPTFIKGFRENQWALAYVMRSMRLICIDIDGKNGGLQGALALGMLPYTLAETSKSGNGYHLFYLMSDDQWDSKLGFAQFGDRIGIQQGVDIRVTGCVYHHPQQRWNNRELVELPAHITKMLQAREQKAAAQVGNIIKVLHSGDNEEVLLMQDALIEDLAKPIPAGRRNNTLFAIGSQLVLAEVEDWDQRIRNRAHQLGLDSDETEKLITNIANYTVKQQPAVTP